MTKIIGFIAIVGVVGASQLHTRVRPRSAYDDLVDPIYPPLKDYHQFSSQGYDIGIPSSEEYAADFPQSFDHQISGHTNVNTDLSAHTLDFQNEFDTLTADYKPIHEPNVEDYETQQFENKVFHQVPAPQLGKSYNIGFDTSAQDFSELASTPHLESHGRSIESVHKNLFRPADPYESAYNTGQLLKYTESVLNK